MRASIFVASFALVLAATAPAFADDVATTSTTSPTRAFAYVDDARIPQKNQVIGVSTVTMTSGGDASRPFAADLARPGGVLESGAEVGLGKSLSVSMSGFHDGLYGLDSTSSGVSGALRFSPLTGGTRLVASFGALRDLSGHAGVFSRASFAADLGALRLAGGFHAQHLFDPTRDALDVMLTAGASVALPSALRLGVEWVGQDLEGALDPLEKEGVRHFVGPTLGFAFGKNLSATAGPALGLSPGSPRTVGRFALVCSF